MGQVPFPYKLSFLKNDRFGLPSLALFEKIAFLTKNCKKDATFPANFKLLIITKFQNCANISGNSRSTLVKMFVYLNFALLLIEKTDRYFIVIQCN